MPYHAAQAILDIYLAPQKLFQTLPDKKKWSWFALGVLLLSNCLALGLFYSPMDVDWIVEQQLLYIGDTMSDIEIEQARDVLVSTAVNTLYISLAGYLVATFAYLLTLTLYVMLVGNSGGKRPFSEWFSLSVWASMPLLVSTLGFITLVILSADPNMPLNTSNYLSLNQLFFNLEHGSTWFQWAEGVNLIYFWCAGLIALGLKHWSNYSLGKALTFGFAPLFVIYGVWALLV